MNNLVLEKIEELEKAKSIDVKIAKKAISRCLDKKVNLNKNLNQTEYQEFLQEDCFQLESEDAEGDRHGSTAASGRPKKRLKLVNCQTVN